MALQGPATSLVVEEVLRGEMWQMDEMVNCRSEEETEPIQQICPQAQEQAEPEAPLPPLAMAEPSLAGEVEEEAILNLAALER
jgi:hypothetical protein